MAYDVLIKNGAIFDGEGSKTLTADLGIKGEMIAEIGKISGGEKVIDAQGKFVTPGFIDLTNHSDTHLGIFKYPALDSLVMQGITTIIGGNCGSSLAPLASPKAIDSIRKWADPSQININWATMVEYLTEVGNMRLGVNYGTLIGYGTLRRGVIGDESRPLGLEEREKVKYLLQQGMKEGAFGLSLGLAYGHERVSATEEIIEIGRALIETWGVIKIHLRSEGKELIASVSEAVRIGRETSIPIEISHLKAIGKKSWPTMKNALEIINNAVSSGVNVNFDVSPYHTTGSLLYLLIPSWARGGGFSDLFQRLNDPWQKEKIIAELKENTLHYDKILVVAAKITSITGKTLAEIAENLSMPPEEALVETVKANEGRVTIIGKTVSPANTRLALKDPNSFVASDGAGYGQNEERSGNLVHPRSFGTFPHFWHKFVMEQGLLSTEEAVKKMTYGPAQKIGIPKRGSLKKGNFADIVIFDPAFFRDRANYHNPYRYPAGIEYVIINGKLAVENGKYLGGRFGRVLRKI